jgi:L-ascorbate metabolism protein UlaG (beta-lactamase superfamily)
MALIPQHRPVDIMLTCIGDHFTMGPERAAAAVALVKPKQVIPMHYGTFPEVLPGTVEAFQKALPQKKLRSKIQILTINQPQTF